MTYKQFQIIASKLKVSDELAAEMLGMTNQQFADLTPETELNDHGTEYTKCLTELFWWGTAVFDNDQESFVTWMNTQIQFFGLRRPIEVAKTLQGIREVKEELTRMEYGILS